MYYDKHNNDHLLFKKPNIKGSNSSSDSNCRSSTLIKSLFVPSIFFITLNVDLHNGHELVFLDQLKIQLKQ